nr:WD repeat-containing protein 53 [Polyrhizophydium stewartii]
MSVCFRPTKSWEIWSGGMDNTIIQWDSSRGTVQAQLQCDAMTSADGADLTGAQGVNPPFVYDLAFNASGRMCVAALGDGTIDCIRWKQTGRSQGGRKPVYEMDRQRVSGPHSWSVSAVEFLPDAAAAAAAGSAGSGGGGGSGVGDATGDWFVSASIDGAVALWSVAPPSGSVLPTPELTSTVTAPRKLNAISVVSVSAAEALVAVGGTAKKGAKRALDAFAIDLASLPLELP